jgi:hypothetical protein
MWAPSTLRVLASTTSCTDEAPGTHASQFHSVPQCIERMLAMPHPDKQAIFGHEATCRDPRCYLPYNPALAAEAVSVITQAG